MYLFPGLLQDIQLLVVQWMKLVTSCSNAFHVIQTEAHLTRSADTRLQMRSKKLTILNAE